MTLLQKLQEIERTEDFSIPIGTREARLAETERTFKMAKTNLRCNKGMLEASAVGAMEDAIANLFRCGDVDIIKEYTIRYLFIVQLSDYTSKSLN
ncbi:hypothetical protein HYV80_00715 [Candidatus Woesearchaeota archaeon]|nr:hypothetical protein [Candidatus Woesearchaeota archaeon]